MSSHSVLIADDHALLREGLRALLSGETGLEIIAEAGDGQEAIRHAAKFKPAIVLMDLSMPHTNGPEAIRSIKRRHPSTKVVVLTMHKGEEFVHAALDAGADAYVLKDDTHMELMSAIRHVQSGQSYISPTVSAIVVHGYLSKSEDSRRTAGTNLTSREIQVLKLIAEGHKNRQIAEFLALSLKTVEKHRYNLMRKLDLHSASALTVYAVENGLLAN